MKSVFKSARSEARTHFKNAFRLVTPPCNTGGFENKYKLTERGDLMKVSFYCPENQELLSTSILPSNVKEFHLSMIAGFMMKEKDLPSDYIIFHDGSIVKFFVLSSKAVPLTTNQKVDANELISMMYAKDIEQVKECH